MIHKFMRLSLSFKLQPAPPPPPVGDEEKFDDDDDDYRERRRVLNAFVDALYTLIKQGADVESAVYRSEDFYSRMMMVLAL